MGMMPKQLATRKIPLVVFDPREDTIYTWLGMAGVLINARGTILLVDPLISMGKNGDPLVCESGYRLKIPFPIEAHQVPRTDVVLYTHADHDHFGPKTAQVFAKRLDCRFVAPLPVASLLSDLGVSTDRIDIARDFESIWLAGVEITVTPALHDWQEENPWGRGDCCGYLIKTQDGTIWHPGDTRLIDPLLEIQEVDVLFFDVAAVDAHLGPEGSARLARSSGAEALVAYHYGTFDLPPGTFGSCNPEDSIPYLAGIQTDFLQPDPGEILRLPLRD
jgi:L-ascorbate metabolism protein UlaG (beta-lactamase superfamily)